MGIRAPIALPGALPGFVIGFRLALTAAWLSLVVVEQINATSGVDYMISLARSYGQTEIILVGLAVYAVLGVFSDVGIRLVDADRSGDAALASRRAHPSPPRDAVVRCSCQ